MLSGIGRCLVLLAAVGGLLLTSARPAHAASALVAVDDASSSLSQAGDGSWTADITLTNLTGAAVTLSVEPAEGAGAGCEVSLSKAAIGAAQGTEAEVTVSEACRKEAEDEIGLTLTAEGPEGAETQDLPITAAFEETDDPDWGHLLAFFIAFPAAALLLFTLFAWIPKRGSGERLEHLEAAYSFKESWVSNVTVIAGLLTGLFGSAEVVKAFLGEDADRSIALATVGSAIALIFIGAGPIMLTATKKQWTEDGELRQAFTVGGLLLATAATVAGATGQLYVGWRSGEALDLGGWEDFIVFGFLAAFALLCWSTIVVTKATIKSGLTPPKPPKPSELAELLKLFKRVLQDNESVPDETIPQLMESVLDSYTSVGTSLGDDPYLGGRRHSAMP